MIRGVEEEDIRAATQRIGETSLDDPGPSTQIISYGIIHSPTTAAANFFTVQEGASSYFGELEEALHGVDGIRKTEEKKSYYEARPPTLEIFPSWPMRFHQNTRGNSQSAGSTDSSSAFNTFSYIESDSPASRKTSSGQSPPDQKQKQKQKQGMIMMASGASRTTPTTAAANQQQQPTTQEKRKAVAGSAAGKDGKVLDAKTLRRLAQNREAAKKSRLRKKAYVQNLETSRIRLQQLEQELQKARTQGLFLGSGPGGANGAINSGAAAFDVEYSRWLDENCRQMSDLRGALQAHLAEGHLGMIVDESLRHYDELFRLRAIMAKSDIFHLLAGMWTTPAERCFLWIGGFRPSELLKMLMPQLDPLTEQQLTGLCGLQQSCQQAEEALAQGLDQLHQSLAETVATGSLADALDVGNYLGHMSAALAKLANLEGFVLQADSLRQQTLHQLRRSLTIRQAARCFISIGEYHTRLRALSSIWASRPRENLMTNESVCFASTDLQIIHQPPLQNHFTAF